MHVDANLSLLMSQLFRKFGWRVAGGLELQPNGDETLCQKGMPVIRSALIASDVLTTWASYTEQQLTDSLLRSTIARLKLQARGQGEVRQGRVIGQARADRVRLEVR